MSNVELGHKCRRCQNDYPEEMTHNGAIEVPGRDENKSRCPFCGEWDCADPASLLQVIADANM